MNGIAAETSLASLDSVDYDPIQHLNRLFAHPSTVSSVGRVSSTLHAQHNGLSADIARAEADQAYGSDSSLERMQSAQAELAGLFRNIESVRARAIETEHNITSMTADIKRLDATKRNLTLSMTALKRLQMLTTAYDQLRGLARSRQYRECASLLQAVLQLMRHFNSYRSIDQIATLSRGVSELQRELLEQVCEDFEMAFAKGEVGQRRQTLVEACNVMDALGDNAKSRIVTWYINTELREYRQVFRGNDEAGSLDNIGRRYAWFKRMMKGHDEEHAAIFPQHWRVGETLAMAFCDGTRDDYKGILERSMRRVDGARIDVNLLLRCLQETLDFEQTIERRFSSEPRASIDTVSSADENRQRFNGSISVAFEPYLSLWVESQDKALAAMIPKYKAQPLLPADEEFSPQSVISSAIELFHFYKLTLSQCAKLSTSERLLDLAKTLAKYLDDYAQQVLLGTLQKHTQGGPSLQDIILVLNTADFWHTNAGQLEENIKKRIDHELVSKVDLSSQADAFMGVASAAVIALVGKVGADCDGAWREMRNTNWSKMDAAGDQSSYIGELVKHVNGKAEEILGMVAKQQYARAFADNLVEHLATAYLANIVQCRPISEVGAEQMLLDKYVLTKSLTNLLSYHNASSSSSSATTASAPYQPPASFAKRTSATMGRMDPLLQTLLVRAAPHEGFVTAYLDFIGDRSDTNFKKILDLKGVRKQDQMYLLDTFSHLRDGPSVKDKLVPANALLTPLMNGPGVGGGGIGGSSSGGMGGGGASLGSSAARFDPTAFGEKLLNAAREGVDRIGTPMGGDGGGSSAAGGIGGGGGVGGAGGSIVPGGSNAAINENLRKMGDFFRRDNFGLGARFGKKDGD
ncbi:subunit of VP52-54 complex [Microdochium trichocladiopsis]|uniref:Subunit of VP52-54 complex n=1 Tax=Microdochium trichocladiopsis TaxID=1682393 RepID=A0A9P9BHJ7_9PEZI|nr:subunit of VP52-54 complex [Microdochium trichocladiopsis]KAH7018554.1 subunit of VP52-54 complex [Microdochium trichocladiopsis]